MMSKELEALRTIKRLVINKHGYGDDYQEEIDTIKQALEEKEHQAKKLSELKSKVKRIKEVIDEGDRRVYYTSEDKYQKIRKIVGEDDE